MTTGERKALLFLAGITVLGAAARIVTAPSHTVSVAERLALATQLSAVDSARASHRATDAGGRGGRRRSAATGERVPRERVRRANAPRARSDPPIASAPLGVAPAPLVDVDVADAAALDALPGIGPALARRIVEERDVRGPFGSLTGLERVRGVGPKLAARVAPRVTFSGVSRLTNAAVAHVP